MYRSEYIVCFRSEISFVPLLFSHRTPFLRPYWQIYFNSTSNHNFTGLRVSDYGVVSYFNSTSNHNLFTSVSRRVSLFLISILHQTTTVNLLVPIFHGCFLFQFYIKPQQKNRTWPHDFRCFLFQFYIKPQLIIVVQIVIRVVSYFNSTSNHNLNRGERHSRKLFLISILHQTTTASSAKS